MNVEYQELINVTLWQKGSKWHSLPKFVCICLCNFLIINSGLYALSLNSYFQLCCDLLEKSYFCSIANNCSTMNSDKSHVVICLKNRTFAVSQTTSSSRTPCPSGLWFAWKIVLLQYRKQLTDMCVRYSGSCDLLEKSYFCSIANNFKESVTKSHLLWFAWKIVLLQYRKQRKL